MNNTKEHTTVLLVVEDEPIIRMCEVDFVESAGFRAVEASNADKAVHLIGTGRKIDIIFTNSTCLAQWRA